MKAEWFAVDWGTSNLRIWVMAPDGQVLKQICSDQGMGTLDTGAFESVLLSHVEGWLPDCRTAIRVIACGMVGAKQGWQEAAYRPVPTYPIQDHVRVKAEEHRLDVRILSGLRQERPADVMRGEETQIAGLLTHVPEFDGVICLPGTHSKWAVIREREIVGFRTLLTGELFDLLSTHSILRHSLGDWSDDVFDQTLKATLNDPQETLAMLFSIRADALLKGDTFGISRLSATLIGSELASMKCYWSEQQVVIVGTDRLTRLYARALDMLGCSPQIHSAADLTLSGLRSAYREIFP